MERKKLKLSTQDWCSIGGTVFGGILGLVSTIQAQKASKRNVKLELKDEQVEQLGNTIADGVSCQVRQSASALRKDIRDINSELHQLRMERLRRELEQNS